MLMRPRKHFRLLFAIPVLIGLACDLAGIPSTRIQLGQPPAEQRQLFQGITYERIVRRDPRPMVIHIVTVDLREEGVGTFVTPGDPEASRPLAATTTSEFLKRNNLQIAINGDAFTPWYDLGLLGYAPKDGDRVTPIGYAASQGTAYGERIDGHPTLYIYKSNRSSINAYEGRLHNAISGYQLLLWRGSISQVLDNSVADPRTAVGINQSGRVLILVVVDGRQPGYSEGATLAELAQILLDHGAVSAMNLDGGGSSTLVIQGENGKPEILNSPIHQGIPGNERPVGNHLGFTAK
ncbi:MAG: phosphodiester glycosidase family protein [Anaerolineales bacterium]